VDGIVDLTLEDADNFIKNHSNLKAGQSFQVVSVKNGIVVQTTLSLNADGITYTIERDEASTSTPTAFVKIWSLTISSTTSGMVTTTNATINYDFTARQSVETFTSTTGQLAATVSVVRDPTKPAPGLKKNVTVTFTNFLLSAGDPHGPRNGTYTQLTEPGIGGLTVVGDSLIILCPANPSNLVMDTKLVGRHYKLTDGSVSVRWDALGSGGQLTQGQLWVETRCSNSVTGAGYSLTKLEDGSGNTVSGSASAGACDAAFGPVPSLTNNATDYDFSAVVTFPGEW
jgi:hypothetical protein